MIGMDPLATVESAYRFLRGNTRGELLFDERVNRVRYVIAPAGRLAAPVSQAMLDAFDTVLFVPANADGAMEIQVTLSSLDPHGPEAGLTDRWRIYHGDPEEGAWALIDIDAARYAGSVIDGVTLVRPNPLAAAESGLCRHINKNRSDDLGPVCGHFAAADVEDPILVGVDPLGFDVRRRFDVVRVQAIREMKDDRDVQEMFDQMSQEAHKNR